MAKLFYILGAIAAVAAVIALIAPSLAQAKWVEQAKIVPDSEAAKVRFAQAVAIDGDTAVIAVPNEPVPQSHLRQSAVRVYTRTGNTWELQAKLFVPATEVGNGYLSNFDFNVALDGNTILAAKRSLVKDERILPIYVFTRSGNTWSEPIQLALPQPPKTDINIHAIVIDGDTAVAGVGAGGTFYIFRRHHTTGIWSYEAELKRPKQFRKFGPDIVIHNNTIVVGGVNTSGAGSAYLYVRNLDTGGWSQEAELTPDSKRDFGYTTNVAISGNTVVVGLPGENNNRGAVYLYERHPDTGEWFQRTRFVPNDVPWFMAYGFGGSVAIDGDTIVVGSSLKHLYCPDWFQFVQNKTAAYVIERNTQTGRWLQPVKLLPQDYEQVARGYSSIMSISGDQVIVTAPAWNSNFATDTVYIFGRTIGTRECLLAS
ncbi:hypothetical protein NUACC21_31240 [Scytonema sp. NUACC21]